jgi:hypothetical protein
MITFKYTFFSKIFYRYSVIPVNLLLLFYIFVSVISIPSDWKLIFPLLIKIILLYIFNRFYFKMYKTFPFKIETNNEEMICSDFVINDRKVTIKHSDIIDITGGIFSGRTYKPLYIITDETKVGISPHLKNYNELLKIILTNVSKQLYLKLLDDIQSHTINNTKRKK